MSFWDDPDVQVSSEYMKFEKVGDQITGTITRLGKRTWPDGNVGVEIMFAEDGVPSVTANQVLLKRALFALKPLAGDHVDITLITIQPLAGGKTLKKFAVHLKRADGTEQSIDQSEPTQPGF